MFRETERTTATAGVETHCGWTELLQRGRPPCLGKDTLARTLGSLEGDDGSIFPLAVLKLEARIAQAKVSRKIDASLATKLDVKPSPPRWGNAQLILLSAANRP